MATCTASCLDAESRKHLALEVLARKEPVIRIAERNDVSRKFLYHQAAKADTALNKVFESKAGADDVLFYLPVTKSWLWQFVLALILICRSSIRGVVELLRDLFQVSQVLISSSSLSKSQQIHPVTLIGGCALYSLPLEVYLAAKFGFELYHKFVGIGRQFQPHGEFVDEGTILWPRKVAISVYSFELIRLTLW